MSVITAIWSLGSVFCSSLKLLILATFSACSCITKNLNSSKSVEALILLSWHFPMLYCPGGEGGPNLGSYPDECASWQSVMNSNFTYFLRA